MKYQDKNTFKITFMCFVILFIGIICTPTAHATESYLFDTQWSADENNTPWYAGIALDSSGNVYTIDQINQQVVEYDNIGTRINAWSTIHCIPEPNNQEYCYSSYPAGIAIDLLDNIYVANYGNNSIDIFDNKGNFISAVYPTNKMDPWTSGSPGKVAVDSSGNIFYTTIYSSFVNKFDKNGNFIKSWIVDTEGILAPGIAIDSSGNVYIAAINNNCIEKFDNNGNLLKTWGSLPVGTGGGQFNGPHDIAIDPSDNVYVADFNNNLIQKFDNNGEFITEWPTNGTNYGQLTHPWQIAVKRSANLLSTSASSGDVYVVGGNFPSTPMFNLIEKFSPGPNEFLPDPNGYSFQNQGTGTHSWAEFMTTYNLISNNLYNPSFAYNPSPFLYAFYNNFFKDESNTGNCFGMDATSLLTYNNGVTSEYGDVVLASPVPSNWLKFNQALLGTYPTTGYPANVQSWIALYQPLQFDLACIQDRLAYRGTTEPGTEQIFATIKNHLSQGSYDLVLLISGHDSGKLTGAHALIPYDIKYSPSIPFVDNYAYIQVYDCDSPGDFNRELSIDLNTGQILDYYSIGFFNDPLVSNVDDLQLVTLKSIEKPPELPDYFTYLKMLPAPQNEYPLIPIGNICYTDTSGNKLGYDHGVFEDQIPGTCPMISSNSTGNNNNSTEAYYVPDPSIKMELFGNGSGSSQIGMGTPNGLIVANVTVSPTSVDEFKILNNGTGVYFNSENDTTQSLGLMLDVETPNQAQIVNSNLSQIEKGGYINLSNNNGTIIIQNNGLQRTGNFTIEQITSTQNTSINITNVAIEGNSTLYINPSNWNDIGNSTVTITDIGDNGQTYYTEIITYKNGQIVQVTFPSAALTIVKFASPTSYDDVGQTITYTYKVTNSGNADILAPITVADDEFGIVPMQNSGTLSPGSSVTGIANYKITQADINAGTVTNAAYAKGSFNNNPISSPLTVALVHYKQPTKKEEHNEEEHNGNRDNYGRPGYDGYGGTVIPMIPGPMYGSPMYGNIPNGYGNIPNVYTSGHSTTEIQNSESNGHKTKSHLSEHKHKPEHKHHTTKHHKNGKKHVALK